VAFGFLLLKYTFT